jgi:hypothetical protein
MPVWRIQHDRMKVGTRVPGSNPPMWVAEVKHAPSMRDMVSDAYAREYNEVRPENFHVPRVPIRMRWWHRLVGAQLALPG